MLGVAFCLEPGLDKYIETNPDAEQLTDLVIKREEALH